MPNNVNTKEDLSLAQLSERTEKLLVQFSFLREATRLMIREVNEYGGGKDIEEASCGADFFWREVIGDLDQLQADLNYLNAKARNKAQKKTDKGACNE